MQRRDFVAQSDKPQFRVSSVYGRADAAHRVAVVEDVGFRTDGTDVGADLQNRWDDTQGVKETARATVLSIDLLNSVLLRDGPVLVPKLKAVADFDGDDNEVRTLESLGPIGGGRH